MLEATPLDIYVSDETFAQLCAENELVRFERSATGVLEAMPPSGAETSSALLRITTQLGAWNSRTGLGIAFGPDAAFRLPNGAIRSPDASWIAIARWEALAPEERARFPRICPDFVLEFVSPTDSVAKTRAKMREYQAQGARLGWLIDPRRAAVEVSRAAAGAASPETLIAPQTLSGEDVLSGFVLDLGDIFA